MRYFKYLTYLNSASSVQNITKMATSCSSTLDGAARWTATADDCSRRKPTSSLLMKLVGSCIVPGWLSRSQEAMVVLVAFTGHNWGSEHDPMSEECSPSSFDGGKYVMYTYSVSGYNPNNKVSFVSEFLNCSPSSKIKTYTVRACSETLLLVLQCFSSLLF